MAKEKQDTPAEPAQHEPAKISFHAAILTSEGSFVVESFPTLEQLAARLRALIDADVTVFAFAGDRLQISKPPFRHLLVPGADPVPLFEIPQTLEPDDTGYLGVDPIALQGPPEVKVPAQSRTAEPLEPLFGDDDNGGDAMGVFDDALPDPDS